MRAPDNKKFHLPLWCEMLQLIILAINYCFIFLGWISVKLLKNESPR